VKFLKCLNQVLEDAATRCQVGPFLLEIKATSAGEVRLTANQAETASKNPDTYVLCVVDLLSLLSEEEIDGEWTALKVEPLTRIAADIGVEVNCENWV